MPSSKSHKTAIQLRQAAAELSKIRANKNDVSYVSEGSDSMHETHRAQASRAAAQLRTDMIEETVTQALAALPEAIEALRGQLGSDKSGVQAARTLLEVAQLVGPRAVNRLDSAGEEGKTIGELESDIGRIKALIESRKLAGRVVSTQSPTGGDENPAET